MNENEIKERIKEVESQLKQTEHELALLFNPQTCNTDNKYINLVRKHEFEKCNLADLKSQMNNTQNNG